MALRPATQRARVRHRGEAPREHESSRAPTRVVIADRLSPTRAGIRVALERGGCRVCGEAGDARTAVAAVLRERPDVCLVDTKLPGGAIEAVAQMTAGAPETAVVMFADEQHDAQLFAAVQAGASGYLPKEMDPTRLPVAVRRAAEGEAALPRALVKSVIEKFREREQRRRSPLLRDLTRRELEVLELLQEGLTTAEIARRLFVAPVTVRTHIASARKKLGLADRAALELLGER